MVVRLVRMEFIPDRVGDFRSLFDSHKARIRSQPGCIYLELLRDAAQPNVFYTYSHWLGPDYLEAYRRSPLFGEVWPATKVLFAAKPQAWSLLPEETIGG